MFFEQTFAAMAGAFFTAEPAWPERVWAAGQALTGLLAVAPAFTRLVLVESYAPDAAAARRSDDLLLGFAVFLQGGQSPQPDAARGAVALAPEAVVGAIEEAVWMLAQEGRTAELPGLVPLGTYLTLAPFAGVAAANELVDAKVAAVLASEGRGS
jgi:hypothetical protein